MEKIYCFADFVLYGVINSQSCRKAKTFPGKKRSDAIDLKIIKGHELQNNHSVSLSIPF